MKIVKKFMKLHYHAWIAFALFIRDLGEKLGLIEEFDDDFYRQMDDIVVGGLTPAFELRFCGPNQLGSHCTIGRCLDRSLCMFLCFDDAKLVRGNIKSLALLHGKDHSLHGWIERGGYVYDPTALTKYWKPFYYLIQHPRHVQKCTREEYERVCGPSYGRIWHKVEDINFRHPAFLTHSILIMTVEATFSIHSDEKLRQAALAELERYKKRIHYDPDQIDRMVSDFDLSSQVS